MVLNKLTIARHTSKLVSTVLQKLVGQTQNIRKWHLCKSKSNIFFSGNMSLGCPRGSQSLSTPFLLFCWLGSVPESNSPPAVHILGCCHLLQVPLLVHPFSTVCGKYTYQVYVNYFFPVMPFIFHTYTSIVANNVDLTKCLLCLSEGI